VVVPACGAGQGSVDADLVSTSAPPVASTTSSVPTPTSLPSGAATTPTTRATTTTAPKLTFDPCPPPLPQKAPPAGMTVTMTLDKKVYQRTDLVNLTMRVKNNGTENVSRTWPRGTTDHDLWVTSGGRVAWLWSHGDLFSGSGPTMYAPGHEETWTERWDGKVCRGDHQEIPPRSPGRFTARGYVVDGDAAWASNEVAFEVR
jgi:hypothetical protein